ncbi:MAG TPA: hypothetical protein VLL49_04595 [Anaerolineales bacterium]|nr:hypothetical protein [Anaerolineales bacterium]
MRARRSFWLFLVSLASLGLYALLALRYPLRRSLADPRASWASMVEPSVPNAALHIAIYLGLTLLYLAALRLVTHPQPEPEKGRSSRPQTAIIAITWLAGCAVLLLVAPAGESHDIYDYIFRGRMMTEYHANPLTDVPNSFGLAAPYTRFIAWRKNVDTYGPVWEALSAAVSYGVRGTSQWLGWWDETHPVCPKSTESCRLLIVYVTGYRLLAISLTGLSGWLIVSIVRRSRAWMAPVALAAWLLNPMTLVATALGGHNDAVMLVLVLLAWWLLQREQPLLALLSLILAAHVKLTALIWLPPGAVWILRRWGWKGALRIGVLGAVSGLVLSWLLYAPLGGWETLPRMLHERSQLMANSPWFVVKRVLVQWWYWSPGYAQQFSVNIAYWISAIVALLVPLWIFNFRPRRWRSAPIPPEESDQKLWRALAVVSMLYLSVGAFWFQHWYVLWALAPAVLLPRSRTLHTVLAWLAFGALTSNLVMSFLFATLLENTKSLVIYVVPVVIIWGPALVAVSIHLLTRQRRRAMTRDSIAA